MIIGIGSDLTNITRIEKSLTRFGERFITRVFTSNEQNTAQSRKDKAAAYAKRWAAKEACLKALGTGLAMGMSWRDISLENHQSGQPYLKLSGKAKAHLDALTPKGHRPILHVTLTDDSPWAQAFVVIEARAE